MGKRFYCDFCDKSFPDNSINRRSHLNGIQHQQARRLHYNQFMDPKEKLQLEKNKKPCLTFLRTGDCSFGPLCKYSHQTAETMRQLEEAVEEQLRAQQNLLHLASEENIMEQLRKFENLASKRRSKRAPILAHSSIPMYLEEIEIPPSLAAD